MYKIDLPTEFEVSNSFNVADFFPFHGDHNDINLKTSFFPIGGHDAGHNHDVGINDGILASKGEGAPISIAHACIGSEREDHASRAMNRISLDRTSSGCIRGGYINMKICGVGILKIVADLQFLVNHHI